MHDFRAIATRYDKRGHNFLAGVTVANAIECRGLLQSDRPIRFISGEALD
jgi:hypothetical protein